MASAPQASIPLASIHLASVCQSPSVPRWRKAIFQVGPAAWPTPFLSSARSLMGIKGFSFRPAPDSCGARVDQNFGPQDEPGSNCWLLVRADPAIASGSKSWYSPSPRHPPRLPEGHTWARGGERGGLPPRGPKKVLPPPTEFLFTTVPLPAAAGGQNFCKNQEKRRKYAVFLKQNWDFFGRQRRQKEKFLPSLPPPFKKNFPDPSLTADLLPTYAEGPAAPRLQDTEDKSFFSALACCGARWPLNMHLLRRRSKKWPRSGRQWADLVLIIKVFPQLWPVVGPGGP